MPQNNTKPPGLGSEKIQDALDFTESSESVLVCVDRVAPVPLVDRRPAETFAFCN